MWPMIVTLGTLCTIVLLSAGSSHTRTTPAHHPHTLWRTLTLFQHCLPTLQLGLDPSKATVLGQMRPFLSKHFLSVAPVIARVPAERSQHAPKPNADEVAAVSACMPWWCQLHH